MLSRARRAVATFLFPTGAELVRCRLWVNSGLIAESARMSA